MNGLEMRTILTILIIFSIQLTSFAQERYSARKGSRFFPGHLDIVLTVDSNAVRYELFNHWYSWRYAELRQITVPLDSLESFNALPNAMSITMLGNKKIKLKDKKYKLNRKIRQRSLCHSPENMRKVAFVERLLIGHETTRFSDLYEREDLRLSEEEFKQKVISNLNKTQ
jgi:hypothetical protein